MVNDDAQDFAEEPLNEPKVLLWDTEFSPLEVYSWSLWPKSIPTGMIKSTQRMLCWGAKWYGDSKILTRSEWEDGREDMLSGLHEVLSEADFVVSWNGQRFDTKMVQREMLLAGLPPVPPYREVDLMVTAKQKFKFASNKLDHVAQELGVGQKMDHAGFEMWRGVLEGDPVYQDMMLSYQKQDVRLLEPVYDKMKGWIKMMHPVSLEAGSCHNCGSTNLQRRGFAKTLSGVYQRFVCNDCGRWHRGTKRRQVTEFRSHHS